MIVHGRGRRKRRGCKGKREKEKPAAEFRNTGPDNLKKWDIQRSLIYGIVHLHAKIMYLRILLGRVYFSSDE